MNKTQTNYLNIATQVLESQKSALNSIDSIICSNKFISAIELINNTNGKIIFTGVGKSGIIAKKISSTISSLGKASFFIHATEASHGDLGMMESQDTLVMLSRSGQTIELEDIFRYAKIKNISIIAITMNSESLLSQESDVALVIDLPNDGFNNLPAPMLSTTVMLVLGDCIAASIAHINNFTRDEYNKLHPGGKLGKSMSRIRDIMLKGDHMPLVQSKSKMREAIIVMSEKKLGLVGVLDNHSLIGLITDGDLRRNIDDIMLDTQIDNVMTKSFKFLYPEMFVDEASEFLLSNNISSAFILDNRVPIGVVNIHSLLK